MFLMISCMYLGNELFFFYKKNTLNLVGDAARQKQTSPEHERLFLNYSALQPLTPPPSSQHEDAFISV